MATLERLSQGILNWRGSAARSVASANLNLEQKKFT